MIWYSKWQSWGLNIALESNIILSNGLVVDLEAGRTLETPESMRTWHSALPYQSCPSRVVRQMSSIDRKTSIKSHPSKVNHWVVSSVFLTTAYFELASLSAQKQGAQSSSIVAILVATLLALVIDTKIAHAVNSLLRRLDFFWVWDINQRGVKCFWTRPWWYCLFFSFQALFSEVSAPSELEERYRGWQLRVLKLFLGIPNSRGLCLNVKYLSATNSIQLSSPGPRCSLSRPWSKAYVFSKRIGMRSSSSKAPSASRL